jgi:hypothetical protein
VKETTVFGSEYKWPEPTKDIDDLQNGFTARHVIRYSSATSIGCDRLRESLQRPESNCHRCLHAGIHEINYMMNGYSLVSLNLVFRSKAFAR